ncbi:MAG TPA: hypothetical protein VFE62_09300 [Gemmataceae bacterium]|nr:hypothetical protein [Gemmataceae bacterium]
MESSVSNSDPDELTSAMQRILEEANQGKQCSIADLAKLFARKPAIGKNDKLRKDLARKAALALVDTGQLFEHPKGRSPCYSATPADPKKYVTKSGLKQLQAVYGKLIKAKVLGADIVAAVSAKLDPPLALNFNSHSNTDWHESAIEFLREFNARRPSESCSLPDFFRAVAAPKGVTLSEFHEGLRTLSKQGRIRLDAWTQPLYMLKEEQFSLILDKEIRYYVRIG